MVIMEADSRYRYRLIYSHLAHAIRTGRIAPGLVLLEGPVAQLFGTSRVPVRKAFEMLHKEGLLCTFDGRGYLVMGRGGAVPVPLRVTLSESALGFDTPPAPLDLPATGERIYQTLEEAVSVAIIFGHFRIDESVAAEMLQVSRGVIREALVRLRDRGLVEKSVYSHWRCGPLTARDVAQDYELRMLLEIAALRLSQPFLQREMLTDAILKVEQAIACPDSVNADAQKQIEAALHVDCLAYGPNRKLLDMIRRAHIPLTVNHVFYNAFNLHPEPSTLNEHCVVLRHLVAGDIDQAVAALHAHLHAAQTRTLQRLKVLAVLPEPELPAFLQRFS
ncbi:GntR family transcriptional regulator [Burkholderia sp. TSV86]|uniref:GntR family transcriptional regulator n=1 Tax=Burkholderia sp. TSV86 TaxID=1385594 RepID=UPI0007520AE3|nr:GntR family transcriptional regulator [Burkholderia sp. TSV86]KVE34810.1 GntR family transcriptional regulator [Burkholderia sp. TSV86]